MLGFFHGRSASYGAPARVRGFLNPLAEIIPYELIQHLQPKLAGALIDGTSGLLLIPVYLILLALTSTYPPRERRILVCVTLLVSACSPLSLSEIGTTFFDNLPPLSILFSVLIMLNVLPASYLITGMLMGMCSGIKLTCMLYAIALAFTTVVRPLGARLVIRCLSAVAVGGFLGFIITGGF